MMQIILIIAIILAVLMVVFTLQNAQIVVINFLFWKFEGSLALILLITFALGAVTSLVISMWSAQKRRKQTNELKRKLKTFEDKENDIPVYSASVEVKDEPKDKKD